MSIEDKFLLKRLAEVGLLATMDRSSMGEAQLIFSALNKIRPHKVATVIGLATVAMHTGKSEEAVRYLESIQLEDASEQAQLSIFLALAHGGCGHEKEKADLLQQVLAEGDAESKELARTLLQDTA